MAANGSGGFGDPTNLMKAAPPKASGGAGGYGNLIGQGVAKAFGGGGGAPAPYSGSTGASGSGGGGGGYQSGGGGGGLQSASGGNFLSGYGNALGFGKPTTIGHYEGPQANRSDYYLGGSQAAAAGLLQGSDKRAEGYASRGFNFDASGAQGGLDASGRGLAMAGGNLMAANRLRSNEQALTNMLTRQANGEGPSIAVDTYNKSAQDATRRAQSLATSARGGSGLLGARQAAEAGFQGAQDAAVQSGMIRKQEMNDARGMLASQLAQRNQAELSRGSMGLGISQGQLARGGLGLDIARTGTGFELQNRGLNDAAEQAERGRYQQMLQANQQGLMGYNEQQSSNDIASNQLNFEVDKTNLAQQNAQDAKRRGFAKSIPVVGKYMP